MRWWLEKDNEWHFDDIIKYIKDFDTVYVGCDSKYHSSSTKFAVAIAVHHKPCVTYWYSKQRVNNMPREIPYRIWTEVEKSMEIAQMIRQELPDINIEVHCDINTDERYSSSKLNQFAMGYVSGCGFIYKSKPHAWCATGCADTHTR
tara:strand:+ start:7805 stop:8245 length:441 start_codon:yes stop_codon:yes gene_type:complete